MAALVDVDVVDKLADASTTLGIGGSSSTASTDATAATATATVFDHIETKLACFQSRESKEMLLQWGNLDRNLTVEKFRFSGMFNAADPGEYDRVLHDFFTRPDAMAVLGVPGHATTPVTVDKELLHTSIMSMTFFDKLKDVGIVTESGNIRGCFDEQFDGITVGDKLREMLVNEDSENAYVFTSDEKKQFIYAVFKLFAVGGAMCQPEVTVDRYLDMTKAFYREVITVYKDSKTAEVKLAGRVYAVTRVAGLDLFPHPDNRHNTMYAIVDPLKKQITVVKNNFMPW
jgi:hypothetical protein